MLLQFLVCTCEFGGEKTLALEPGLALTKLSGVPSALRLHHNAGHGRSDSSWHPLHSGTGGKIIERHSVQKKKNNNHHFTAQSRTSAAAAAAGERHPPASAAIHTSACSVQPLPSFCFFLRTLRLPLPSLAQASLLFWAQSDVFCSHNRSNTHLLFPLHCLPPLLQPISGPACQLSPCCQRVAASDSMNWFCKPSAAAVVSIPPAASVPSVLFPSSLSDVRQSQGVNSSFTKMLRTNTSQ